MRYKISGKQIDIGISLQIYVKEVLGVFIDKYAQRATNVTVIFSRNAHEFVCEATLHLSTGLIAQAKAHDTEIYAAFDCCNEKLEKQLRRYKRRLKNHYKECSEPVELSQAASYTSNNDSRINVVKPESLEPVVILETEYDIASLSVAEAVMKMELKDSAFLIFRIERKSSINVVYRRDDGNIGWIEPR